MNLKELRDACRQMLDDQVAPYLWSDDTLTRFLNNAVREVCFRARMLRADPRSLPSLCSITVDPSAGGRFLLDPSIIAIRSGSLSDGAQPLWAVSSHDMDDREPGWDAGRVETGEPYYMVMDLEQKGVQLWPVPPPGTPVTVLLRAWRVPIASELMKQDDDEPVVILPDPEELKHWVAHEAYLIKDADTYDPASADRHLGYFEARFGARPTFHEMARWADSPPRRRRTHMF